MDKPRIITGKYKGRTLRVPESARPVTDRIKTVIFDTLGSNVEGKSILDLFAGSGSLGIEALSRGADSGTFVEQDIEAGQFLEDNLSFVEEPVEIFRKDYKIFIKNTDKNFDIIFLDPPFAITKKIALKLIATVLRKNGIIVLRSNEPLDDFLAKKWNIVENKKIGISYVYFLIPNNA